MKPFSAASSRITALPDEPSALRRLGNVHFGPFFAAVLLALVGLLTVHSASSELDVDYLPRQAVWVVVGLIALVVTMLVGYHRLVDAAPSFYAVSLILLVIVLFAGRTAGGARSWLAFGPFSFQPSELAKLTTLLLLTRYLSRIERADLELREIFGVFALVAVPVFLVALERDLGGAAMFAPMLLGMLLVAGVRWRQMVAGLLLGGILAAGLWTWGMKPYQRQRIVSYLSPEADPLGAGYQVRQSKIAVGSGQWTGRGYGQGTQSQLRFLPERHTDFIMAVLAEEWGFLGVLTVLALFSLYILSAFQIAARGRDRAAILLVAGWVSLFTFHVLYNTAMVVGLLPVTGVPLPFLSYGGSFALLNFVATGLLLNVDYRRYVNR